MLTSAEKPMGSYGPERGGTGQLVIIHCRIAERSSYTWFVPKYLVGSPDVRNDGLWTD